MRCFVVGAKFKLSQKSSVASMRLVEFVALINFSAIEMFCRSFGSIVKNKFEMSTTLRNDNNEEIATEREMEMTAERVFRILNYSLFSRFLNKTF
jgi:hypothetical protein